MSPRNTSTPGSTQRRQVLRVSSSSLRVKAPKPRRFRALTAGSLHEVDEDVLERDLVGVEPAQREAEPCDEGGHGAVGDLEVGDVDDELAPVATDRARPDLRGQGLLQALRVVHLDDDPLGAAVARPELVDAGLLHDPAAGEHRHGVADALDVGEDVRGEEDGGAAGERRDHLEHLAAPDRVERAGRLVEQQQARRVDQRLGDAEALLHAARVAADLGGHAGEAGEVEQRARCARRARAAGRPNRPAESSRYSRAVIHL